MENPSISLRRHPTFASMLLVLGFAAASVGLLFSEFWVLFLGVLPIIFAALLMLNPMVVITDKAVEFRNVFGVTRATFPHDGFHLLLVQHDTLYIQRGDMRAALHSVARKRLHAGDWRALLATIEDAKEHQLR